MLDFEKIFCEITNRILSTEMGIFYGASYGVILQIPYFLKKCPGTLSKLAISKVQKFEKKNFGFGKKAPLFKK